MPTRFNQSIRVNMGLQHEHEFRVTSYHGLMSTASHKRRDKATFAADVAQLSVANRRLLNLISSLQAGRAVTAMDIRRAQHTEPVGLVGIAREPMTVAHWSASHSLAAHPTWQAELRRVATAILREHATPAQSGVPRADLVVRADSRLPAWVWATARGEVGEPWEWEQRHPEIVAGRIARAGQRLVARGGPSTAAEGGTRDALDVTTARDIMARYTATLRAEHARHAARLRMRPRT